ncbi:MAG: nucleotide pyrophosphohydrolase [Saprospiraceae bacterium]
MTIEDYQKSVDQWINTMGVRYFSPLTNMAILTEEVGEVARLMARIHGDQSFKEKDDEAFVKDKLADELADVMWVLTCIANQNGINLTNAVEDNMIKKNVRDKTRHINNPKLKQ